MATKTSGEKPKKGTMYVYNYDTGNPKPEPELSTMLKKGISKGWGLRRSKTYRENNQDELNMKTRKSVSSIEGVKVNIESRNSVSSFDQEVKKVVESRKSVSSIDAIRKSMTRVELNVASMAAVLQVKVLVTDMPGFMQVHAFKCARTTYDSLEKFSSKHMAYNMKKDFDKVYGPAWHCIVGSSFGSYVTHSTGCFLYFSIEKLYILVFKTKVQKSIES